MGKEILSGLMGLDTTENSLTTISKEQECMNGQMAEDFKELGKTIKWMAKEFLTGLTKGGM